MTDRIRDLIAAKVASLRAVDYSEALPCDYETADAVLALVGPKPLVWDGSISGEYAVTVIGDEWWASHKHVAFHGGFAPSTSAALAAAQSAAQAHADAAHWRNTPLGGMIGGEG